MPKIKVAQLAKDLGIEVKDVLALLEKIGIRGKRSQGSLEDEEVARVRSALGGQEKPQVHVGEEKVVAERVVTAEDQTLGEVRAREQVVERRVRTNVIRRRTSRVEVIAQPAPPPAEPPRAAVEAPAAPIVEQKVASPFPPAPEIIEEPPAPPAVEEIPVEIEEAAVELSTAPQPSPPAPEPKVIARPAAEPKRAEPEPQREEAPRGARVLGRIDLRQGVRAEPQPAPSVAPKARPLEIVTPSAARVGDAQRPVKKADGVPGAAVETEEKPKGPRHKKRVIKKQQTLDFRERELRSGRVPKKKRALPGIEQKKTEITVPKASKRVVKITEVISVGDLARLMGIKGSEVIRKLIGLGMMATINQMLDTDTAAVVASEFDYQVENVAFDAESVLELEHTEEAPEGLQPRSPVVTIMGHVDHGKTSLLDAIRSTNVTAKEAGGITQHIGAYHVEADGRSVTFLDTPGHEAFTAMRARGAKVTDIVVLVVAADDGVMPQTIEAINHARAADVPIIVAVNKIDKPGTDVERVKRELSQQGLAAEDWGGNTIFVPVSAKTKEGIPHLIEMLLLQADVLELTANPSKLARGTIVEAKLDRGRGPVATVLVQEGTLRVGDAFVCGAFYGRVRAMIDDRGRKVDQAPPSMPVEILGLQGVPLAGDSFVALADEARARQIAEFRTKKRRETEMVKSSKISLEDLYEQIKAGDVKELRVVVKADVHGSAEALSDAMSRLSTDEVKLRVIHSSVGGITESDILLAAASNAIVIGFNVRPEAKATSLAAQEGVDVRLYTIIYEVMADIRAAMEGLLEPTFREHVQGHAQVRQIFTVRGQGSVAGCYVTDGKIQRSYLVRLLRDQVVIHEGKLASLKRFKDDVREVTAGFECGMAIDGFQDVKVGDVIEAYEKIPVIRRMSPESREREASHASAGEKR
ncbi:MAG: translation initiation factor IF-2 [Candidatus Binatia bacterium]